MKSADIYVGMLDDRKVQRAIRLGGDAVVTAYLSVVLASWRDERPATLADELPLHLEDRADELLGVLSRCGLLTPEGAIPEDTWERRLGPALRRTDARREYDRSRNRRGADEAPTTEPVRNRRGTRKPAATHNPARNRAGTSTEPVRNPTGPDEAPDVPSRPVLVPTTDVVRDETENAREPQPLEEAVSRAFSDPYDDLPPSWADAPGDELPREPVARPVRRPLTATEASVKCDDYRAHQHQHVRVTGRGWVCPPCDKASSPMSFKDRVGALGGSSA